MLPSVSERGERQTGLRGAWVGAGCGRFGGGCRGLGGSEVCCRGLFGVRVCFAGAGAGAGAARFGRGGGGEYVVGAGGVHSSSIQLPGMRVFSSSSSSSSSCSVSFRNTYSPEIEEMSSFSSSSMCQSMRYWYRRGRRG